MSSGHRGSPRTPFRSQHGPSRRPSTPSLRGPPSTPAARKQSRSPVKRVEEPPVASPKPQLSIKEAIALKRAEAKKSLKTSVADTLEITADGQLSPTRKKTDEDPNDLGRWSVRETVERARNTGILNLSSRALPCLPNCLFDIHLGVTPAPLKLVSEEEASREDRPASRPRIERSQPTWFEAQDLQSLKARSNDIREIHPELSLFGSLKVIDFHHNQLQDVPASLTALSSLTTLDLSSNKISTLPPSIFSLPSLTTLNLAHNEIESLRLSEFDAPFDAPDSRDSFYTPQISRANCPLPKLQSLDVSHNKLSASTIDTVSLPANITNIVLSHNTLGDASTLILHIASLAKLQTLHMAASGLDDTSLDCTPSVHFPSLRVFDLEDTKVSADCIRAFFKGTARESQLNFEVTTSDPLPGELRVIVGKKIIKEAWEVEAEKRFQKKRSHANFRTHVHDDTNSQTVAPPTPTPVKESWEIEAEQGLLTEGARRRARMTAIISETPSSSPPPPAAPAEPKVTKEAWEIEAEQGLLTEGGRRRARAAAASERSSGPEGHGDNPSCDQTLSGLSHPNYYTEQTATLTLPPSAPPKRGHSRAFTVTDLSSKAAGASSDLHIPTPALPLDVIAIQSFAASLRILNLSKRRADPSFHIPIDGLLKSKNILPRLEELSFEGCSLEDTVSVVTPITADDVPSPRKEKTLDCIATLFPRLHVLDLSYNSLTSDAFTSTSLDMLLSPSMEDETPRKGLKLFRLRGNRISSLDAFEQIASHFKGNRVVDAWQLEELDLRDNEIPRLPPTMGLMPLDVFLVDGNTFRIPPRKVWEREGTKGLLSWLRGRVE